MLLLFCHSVVSDSLWPHRLQHARLPCPSLSPRVCLNSWPLSQWCHPTFSYSVTSSPLALNLSQHQCLYQWVGSSHQVVKILELQHQHESFQWIFRVDFFQHGLIWSLCCPRDSQESSPAPRFKSINSLALNFPFGPTLTSMHDCWKNYSSD